MTQGTQEINIELKFSGNGSKYYTLTAYKVGTSFESCSGIYIFIRYDDNYSKWNIVYIGTTGNFQNRIGEQLSSHHKWDDIKQHGATHIVLLSVRDKTTRLKLEKELISSNYTPCNIQYAHPTISSFILPSNLANLFGVNYAP